MFITTKILYIILMKVLYGVMYYLTFQYCVTDSLFQRHFFKVCLLCLCARLFKCALLSPAEKEGLTCWLSFVVSNCEFITFPLVSWFICGT